MKFCLGFFVSLCVTFNSLFAFNCPASDGEFKNYLSRRIAVSISPSTGEKTWLLPPHLEWMRNHLEDLDSSGEAEEYLANFYQDPKGVGAWVHFQCLDRDGKEIYVWSAATPTISRSEFVGSFRIYSDLSAQRKFLGQYSPETLPDLNGFSLTDLVRRYQKRRERSASLKEFDEGRRLYSLRSDAWRNPIAENEILLRAEAAPIGEYIRIDLDEEHPELKARGEILLIASIGSRLELIARVPAYRLGEFLGQYTARRLLQFASANHKRSEPLIYQRPCESFLMRLRSQR